MPQHLIYLRETASQTAGPYVHIGLAPGAAGFHLFKKELGTDIAGPDAAGERIRACDQITLCLARRWWIP
jgi:protocatechuate 3,4-dioxygenase alpha subunit